MSTSNPRLPSVSRSLPMALMRARETVMAPIREMLQRSGISEQQWRVLRVLAEAGPVDASTLAHRANLLMPSLTRMMQSMQERGLVSRMVDETDKRRVFITLAPAGQDILDLHREEAAALAARFEGMLGAQKLNALLDLLAELEASGQPK